MFDFVRSHNRIMQVALGLVLVPLFVASGVQGYTHFFSEAAESVASVDGKEITRAEWDARQRQAVENLRRRNPQADLKQLDSPEAKRAALDALIRERVLQAAAAHQELAPSNERALTVFK